MPTIDQIQRRNENAGQHFFEPDTLRFFKSRVLPTVYGRGFFVTSEKRGFDDSRRAFTIRLALDDGSVETVGEFLGWSSRAAAQRAAEKCAGAKAEVRFDPYDGAKNPTPQHYAWRVYVNEMPIGPRNTRHQSRILKNKLNKRSA